MTVLSSKIKHIPIGGIFFLQEEGFFAIIYKHTQKESFFVTIPKLSNDFEHQQLKSLPVDCVVNFYTHFSEPQFVGDLKIGDRISYPYPHRIPVSFQGYEPPIDCSVASCLLELQGDKVSFCIDCNNQDDFQILQRSIFIIEKDNSTLSCNLYKWNWFVTKI